MNRYRLFSWAAHANLLYGTKQKTEIHTESTENQRRNSPFQMLIMLISWRMTVQKAQQRFQQMSFFCSSGPGVACGRARACVCMLLNIHACKHIHSCVFPPVCCSRPLPLARLFASAQHKHNNSTCDNSEFNVTSERARARAQRARAAGLMRACVQDTRWATCWKQLVSSSVSNL